jgi:cysteine-S-conjugate beta-lyase
MMKTYNFDEIIKREGTNSIKYDARKKYFHNNNVLPFWVADTDFRTPDFVVEAIKKRADHEIFGYTFKPDSYYQAIEGWMQRRHNWKVEKEWISFSPGVVAGITIAIETFTKPGDGIIVQPPVYFPFFDCVKGTRRKVVENPLKLKNNRYTFNLEDLKSKAGTKPKMLLLCNPQNPGGMVWTRDELQELTDFCLNNNILIVSDEIHSDLVFEGHRHIPLSTLSDEVAANSVICMAPSKSFNVAGLASSLVIIPDKNKFARFERVLNVGHLGMGNIFGSVAMEAAFAQGDVWLGQLLVYLWKNYLFLKDFFDKYLPKVKIMKPEATYLIWLDFTAYGMNDKELNRFIIEKAGVGLNNGVRFGTGGEGWMRLNIGCPRSMLAEGLKRLHKAFKGL